jgi:hypothetical protein
VAIVVSILALLFTVGAFWYMNLWPGRLKGYGPSTWAGYVSSDELTLRIPVLVANSGARPKVITNVRLRLLAPRSVLKLSWQTFRVGIRPTDADIKDMATHFVVPGRSALREFVEFRGHFEQGVIEPREYEVKLDMQIDGQDVWREIASFALRLWHFGNSPDRYIARSNSKDECRPGERLDAPKILAETMVKRWHMDKPSWAPDLGE